MPAEADGRTTQPAAYFTSLSLENVRCFGETQTLDLSDGQGGPARWTILLGENGTGKTIVLQALAHCASGGTPGTKGAEGNFDPGDALPCFG